MTFSLLTAATNALYTFIMFNSSTLIIEMCTGFQTYHKIITKCKYITCITTTQFHSLLFNDIKLIKRSFKEKQSPALNVALLLGNCFNVESFPKAMEINNFTQRIVKFTQP